MAEQKNAEKNQICAGCGAEAPEKQVIEDNQIVTLPGVHPWVGIGHEDLDGPGGEPEKLVAHPVCDACHQDPLHRTVNKLKVHFETVERKRIALVNAREQTMLQDPTPAQAAKQREYLKNKKAAASKA